MGITQLVLAVAKKKLQSVKYLLDTRITKVIRTAPQTGGGRQPNRIMMGAVTSSKHTKVEAAASRSFSKWRRELVEAFQSGGGFAGVLPCFASCLLPRASCLVPRASCLVPLQILAGSLYLLLLILHSPPPPTLPNRRESCAPRAKAARQ